MADRTPERPAASVREWVCYADHPGVDLPIHVPKGQACPSCGENEPTYTQADLDFFSANADEYFAMASRFRVALSAIKANAEAWHGDDAAKGRALAVIAKWAKEALDADA